MYHVKVPPRPAAAFGREDVSYHHCHPILLLHPCPLLMTLQGRTRSGAFSARAMHAERGRVSTISRVWLLQTLTYSNTFINRSKMCITQLVFRRSSLTFPSFHLDYYHNQARMMRSPARRAHIVRRTNCCARMVKS